MKRLTRKVRKRRRSRGIAKKKHMVISKTGSFFNHQMAIAREISPLVAKYWTQRFSLFSRYNEGIRLDEEGWYSVTPEAIASDQAKSCRDVLVIDCFSGVGGNAIQFAKSGCHVLAIDVDPQKVEFSRHNANIYGVGDFIDFIVGDFFHLAPFLRGNVAFLSPPWGGPDYNKIETFTLEMLKPQSGYSIFKAAQQITPNIVFFLPRNIDFNQIRELSWLSSPPLDLQVLFICRQLSLLYTNEID
ncbi:Trimethylguanosine synthase [Nymphaea thermarum]|nr:Trimethylguanosine synthase [Nymphaea thermarum]